MSAKKREPNPREGTPGDETHAGGESAPGQRPGVAGRDGDDRSMAQLIRDLADEGSELLRQELALAKAEMQEKVDTFQSATITMATGGALIFAALLAFLWALNTGLTALFAQWMSIDVAIWLAPVVMAVVLAAIGFSMVKAGQSMMEDEDLTPERTRESLKRDRRWARTRARTLKEEVRHDG